MNDLILLALILVAAGGLSGFLAGVFGVGGGTVVVPVLYEVFVMHGVNDAIDVGMISANDVPAQRGIRSSSGIVLSTSAVSMSLTEPPRIREPPG